MKTLQFKQVKVKDVENGNRVQLVDRSVKKVLRVQPSTVFRRAIEIHFQGGEYIVKKNSDLIPVAK